MKKIFSIFILSFVFMSCARAQTDFSRVYPPIQGHFSTQSHYVESINGCTKVWIGVFWNNSEGGQNLVSSGFAYIGAGCNPVNHQDKSNPLCENGMFKDDYIINSEGSPLCLIECLKEERIYSKYESEKYRILSEIKK